MADFVLVPRAAMDKYQHLPFSVLLAAADTAEDGLERRTGTSMPMNASVGGVDVVLFRHAELWEFRDPDRACLHLQNFGKDPS